ncbi:nucleoside phosphorylase domain-containing protein [Dactylonectria estremocensis]|uniref:Nucleoside phosphorylase domain-containing protein n=1 Tax=Dactylonectria estremocensis TaxID=1079267 RepID=A0A9P9J789_9HYPO|nr:nucleoside phosphorylase domain-containing protein [Dactylonectria estremocensis]
MASQPDSRSEFEIAIVFALSREYNSVSRLVDQFWETNCGRAAGDSNAYVTGRIGDFNIVLLCLSDVGKSSAASTTACLRMIFLELKLVLLPGICGGVPSPGMGEELLLGDVVIDKTVVQYDLGKRYPERFQTKDNLDDSLGRLTKNAGNFVTSFEKDMEREKLEERAASHLAKIQTLALGKQRKTSYQYLGAIIDVLFKANYRHRHQNTSQKLCDECNGASGAACEESRRLSCKNLGCDENELLQCERLKEKQDLESSGLIKESQASYVFVGRFGSGDTVLTSGEKRNTIAKRQGVMAFKMEGARVWDEIPCIIAKGVCDYTDSHKNDLWQDFAAAPAAGVTMALIEQYPQADKPPSNKPRVGLIEDAQPGRGSVQTGSVSGSNVLTGFESSGGTQNFNFVLWSRG